MFEKPYEERLSLWRELRNSLEVCDNPLQIVLDFYKKAATVSINVDPYTQSLWLDPWELLHENTYCEFCILLGICYTLQLTERFSQSHFEIHITQDKQNSTTKYLLITDETVVSIDGIVSKDELLKSLEIEKRHVMPRLQ